MLPVAAIAISCPHPLNRMRTRAAQSCSPSRLPSINDGVFRHIYSWHRIHRTRGGAYIPVTTCPAGANTLLAVMSGTLEVLVYAPADGLPCLKPTFGNTPCSPSGAEDSQFMDEQEEPRSDVHDATINEKPTKTQTGSLDDKTTVGESGGESNMTPKPSPRRLLEEALGLGRKNLGEQDQSLPRKNFVDETVYADSTKGKSIDESVQYGEGMLAVGATRSTLKSGGDFSDPLESLHWPHEPRYCADVWQQDGYQDDGAVTRYVWIFPSAFLHMPRASLHALYSTYSSGGRRAEAFDKHLREERVYCPVLEDNTCREMV